MPLDLRSRFFPRYALFALALIAGTTASAAGSAIVNALGPIRQVVQGENKVERRYLVIVAGTAEKHGAALQIQAH